METERVTKISSAVGGQVRRIQNSWILEVGPDHIGDACRMVVEDGEYYHLSTITGLDSGEKIDVLYHFWRGKEFINLKTSVPKADPRLRSISDILPAALFYEAEVMDLLGVVFENNPLVGKKLLLPDAYPENAPPPLRKEADPEKIRRMMGLE
jgi:NADH:ubiquinone oxidoreductase subunit C